MRTPRQKGKFALLMAALLVVVCLLSPLRAIPSSSGQLNASAFFTSIEVTNDIGSKELINGGTAEVYYGQNPVYVNLTLYNVNCSTASGYVFGVEAVAVLSGHNWNSGNVSVNEGTNGTIMFNLCNLTCATCSQATGKLITDSIWTSELGDQFLFTFRLYYYGFDGRVVEDEKTINLVAVAPIAFSQDTCKIEKGQSGTLGLNITNLDDEPISGVNLTLTDSNGFEFSPNATGLNEILGSATKAVALDVTVPDNLETGSYNTTFRIDYIDFSGGVHAETETASISVEPVTVEPKSDTLMMYYLIIAAVVAVAFGGLLLVYRRRVSKKKETQAHVRKVS